ncbi:MAG: cytochrome c3 family protein [bacterium]
MKWMQKIVLVLVLMFLVSISITNSKNNAALVGISQTMSPGNYVVIGWNDLGMHCMGKDYSSICILPPYNNLWAQVIHRGNPPSIVTTGINLAYSFQNNSYSVGKINFWSYDSALFGVNLPDNTGLTGLGLTGNLTWNGTAFEARGVPLTGYDDGSTIEQAYQLARVALTFSSSAMMLDSTMFVAPVSVEMNCALCHSAGAGPTVYDNILRLHDSEEGTNLFNTKPILCAKCHASNALGMSGTPGLPSLSQAMHGFHASEVPSISCYNCHPGVTTQCLRGAMYLAGKTCTNCHGTIAQVANSISTGRRPWLDEPRCANCHTSTYAENSGVLYRNSTGHGGVYCEACHNSTHAELPTVQPRDGIQAFRLQGTATPLSNCMICHTVMPTSPGPHGKAPTAVSKWKHYDMK